MEAFVTYYKNRVGINSPENESSDVQFENGIHFQIEQVSEVSFALQQDTLQTQKDSIPVQPTLKEIRQWRWLHEKKMLIDGSRYIQPKNEVKLVSSVIAESNKLSLPIREINHTNTDWLTILLLLVTILLASVRFAYSKYIGNLFQSLINYSTSYRMFRERNYPFLHGAFRLEAIFYLIFSIFLFQIIQYFHLAIVHKSFTFYALSLLGVLLYFFVKKIIYSTLGMVFEGALETKEYLFNMDNFNRMLGLVLFPIVALINYYPTENPVFMVFTGIITIAIFYVFQLQRGIYILLKKQFSLFYLFLYLCSLEFVPLILIYKVVVL